MLTLNLTKVELIKTLVKIVANITRIATAIVIERVNVKDDVTGIMIATEDVVIKWFIESMMGIEVTILWTLLLSVRTCMKVKLQPSRSASLVVAQLV